MRARQLFESAQLPWPIAAIVIVLALVLGGGTVQGLRSDAIVQLASLPVVGLAAIILLGRSVPSAAQYALALAAGIVFVPLVQLVPLPPEIWTRLPGRGDVVEGFELAAIPLTWSPISLDPSATWRALLSLLPPLAVFLATLGTGYEARRRLVVLLVGFALVSVTLGLLQLMQGPASPLRFHVFTNPSSSVGFFANRNHYAALLYSILPFAVGLTVGLGFQHRNRAFGLAVGGFTIAALLLGLGMAQSRAGVVVGLLSLLFSVILFREPSRSGFRLSPVAILAAGLAGILLIVHYALPGLLTRFEASTIDDYRFEILGVGWAAADTFLPIGSGLGTFEAAYQMHDRTDALLTNYVNHAHNDWLELWIEGGWTVVPIAAAFLVWFGMASYRTWRTPSRRQPSVDIAIARAASISVFLLLLHSLVDYPLRTTGVATVFALCCALLVRPVQAKAEDPPGDLHRGRMRGNAGRLSAKLAADHAR